MSTRHPKDQPTPGEGATDEADVEGHSRIGALFVGATVRTRKQEREKAAARATDETLPALTKPFPRLRDDTRR
jgi:hypothetical protein